MAIKVQIETIYYCRLNNKFNNKNKEKKIRI